MIFDCPTDKDHFLSFVLSFSSIEFFYLLGTKQTFMKRIILFILVFFTFVRSGFSQDTGILPKTLTKEKNISILESRFLTTQPIVGEAFQYFLKFDYKEDLRVYPVEHFTENGITIIEQKCLEPQKFQGRVIEQYEYTLSAQQEGEHRFIPISIQYVGPLKNPLAAQTELAQIVVLAIVEVQVVTNSPLMLNEVLELKLSVAKRKPVTITSMPHTLEAPFQVPTPDMNAGKMPPSNTLRTGVPSGSEEPGDSSSQIPTLPPPPPPLRFELDQSQNITPQQTDEYTTEQYTYNTVVSPEKAGEYVIPEFTITYRTAAGEEVQISTPKTSIFVLNPNTGNLTIQTNYRVLIFPAIVVAMMILTGIGVFFYLRYRKRRRLKRALIEPPLPPGEIAHQELSQIQALRLPAKGEFKTYYSMVSESVRKFLGAEFSFHVLERTTEEVLQDIQKRDVPDSVREHTGKFLQKADMVKFAKYIPLPEEADAAMEQALTIVDESIEYHLAKAAEEATVEHVKDSPEVVSKT